MRDSARAVHVLLCKGGGGGGDPVVAAAAARGSESMHACESGEFAILLPLSGVYVGPNTESTYRFPGIRSQAMPPDRELCTAFPVMDKPALPEFAVFPGIHEAALPHFPGIRYYRLENRRKYIPGLSSKAVTPGKTR